MAVAEVRYHVDELQDNNSSHTKGTICLVNGVNGRQKDVFRAWAHERAPYNSQWLVLRIGGADYLHCRVTNSI